MLKYDRIKRWRYFKNLQSSIFAEIVTIRKIFQHGIHKYFIYYDIDAAYIETENVAIKNYYWKKCIASRVRLFIHIFYFKKSTTIA